MKPPLRDMLMACVLLWSTAASAQPVGAAAESGSVSSARSTAAPELTLEKPSWYGWQTLISDVLGVTLVMVSMEAGHEDVTGFLGASALLFGAPIIHAVHGNWLGFGVSLGVRAASGLALLGGLAELLGDGSPVLAVGLIIGSLVGGLAASLLDALCLAFEKARPKRYALTPWVHPRGAAGLQLTAAF